MTDMGNSSESNNMNSRQSASPARTIDSHGSTNGSMDTIIDRSSLNREQLLEQSTNTTNAQQLLQQHHSLTNSEAAMLQLNSSSASDEEQQQQPVALSQPITAVAATTTNNRTTLAQQQQLDAQSHIYSSPVYDEKPPLKQTTATLLKSAVASTVATAGNDALKQQPKLITHKEFQRQLQEIVASRANTLDSRISKKQRFPPELIKIKDGDGDGASSRTSSARSSKTKRSRRSMPSSACCSAFPLQIILGTLQLLLAVSIVALGSLLIVRDAALATAGCGIWTGLIAAVTGSLGVVSMRKTQTAFLALSLVCIATSTLALAISSVGLSRDVNHMEEKLDFTKLRSVISAASGLIFALFLHFIVSVVSVYRCALQICASSKSQNGELRDVIIKSSGSGIALDQEKVSQYIKEISLTGSDKENAQKLASMWMYTTHVSTLPPTADPTSRPIMLIPASSSSTSLLAASPVTPPPLPMMVPPGMTYRSMSLPYPPPPPGSMLYAPPPPGSIPSGTYRTHRSSKSGSGLHVAQQQHQQQRRRRAAQAVRSGKMEANRRQRRKSAAEVIDDQEAFQYTGLDRAIANSFLARQEQSHAVSPSYVDYSSSSSVGDTYGGRAVSRASSKTKIICRDVVM